MLSLDSPLLSSAATAFRIDAMLDDATMSADIRDTQSPDEIAMELNTDRGETQDILARESYEAPTKLETTGVTSQSKQGGLWKDAHIWRESVSAKLRSVGALDLAEPLERCGQEQSWARCTGCGTVRTFFNRCEHFYCPSCAPALARDRRESVEWWTKEIRQPKHIVLTARNTTELTFDMVKRFKAAFAKLRRSKVFNLVRGGMWSLEVTNESRGWHLHLHALVDARWIDKAELSARWGKLVGQDYAIVCVKDVRKADYLAEVTKYAVKGSQLACWPAEQIVTFIRAFKGQRTFGVFGDLYGKRTLWREWLDSIRTHGFECKCGCTQWQMFSDQEWQWWLLTHETATRPPPIQPCEPQRMFAL